VSSTACCWLTRARGYREQRAPGHAPVADACGLAGGTPWAADAPEEGQYINTTHAHHGMKGTDLPEMPTGTVWKAGGTAEVAWNVRFNHGGGCECSQAAAAVLLPSHFACNTAFCPPQTRIASALRTSRSRRSASRSTRLTLFRTSRR
jgi:hypothetical protein